MVKHGFCAAALLAFMSSAYAQSPPADLCMYVGNDPANKTDPSGQWQQCPTMKNCIQATSHYEKGTTHVPSLTLAGKRQDSIEAAIPRYNLSNKGGKDEKTGFNVERNGEDAVVDTASTTRSSNPNGALRGDFSGHTEAVSAPPAGRTDEIHGHIVDGPNKANGLADPSEGPGDVQPLIQGMTNTTVFADRAGVRETPDGRLQFRMLRGTMGPDEMRVIGENLDKQQGLLEDYFAH
jgi:hypothetical protein